MLFERVGKMRAKIFSLDKREPGSFAGMLTHIQPFMDLEQGNKTKTHQKVKEGG